MTDDDIRALAEEALEDFGKAALNDPKAHAGGRNGARAVAEAVGSLRARLEPRGSANPSYGPAHEAAAALVAIAATDPETYATLLGPVFASYRTDPDPRTLEGLWGMDGFLKAIGDDHDWCADLAGEAPVIRHQATLGRHEPTLNPSTLCDVLVPLLEARETAPSP